MVRNLPAYVGYLQDMGLVPGLGRFPGEHCNLLQFSCLENPMNRRVWQAMVNGLQRDEHNLSDLA